MQAIRIGVVGIGNVGLPMALRLQTRGFAVTVCDTDPLRAALATRHRVRIAPSPAEAARYSRCTIIAVANGDQVQQVLFGSSGVMEVLGAGDCVMICSSIPAEELERHARALADRNISCIDAPFSGGPDRASYGTLSMVVSCDNATFERHKSMIDVLSSRVMRVGTRVGMASRAKLVNNLVAAINLAGMAEAMAMAERFGLNPKHMLEIMESSSGQSWIGSDRLVRRLRGETDVHASIALMAHEVRAALVSAQTEGLHTPIGQAALLEYLRACERGLGGKDDSAMFDHARSSATLESDDVESVAVGGESLEGRDAIKALSRRAAAL